MADEFLSHLTLTRRSAERFRTPRGGGGDRPELPERDPGQHATDLLRQIDAVAESFAARQQRRLQDAVGHLVTAEAAAGATLVPEGLGDKRTDAVVVLSSSSRAVVHLRRDQVAALRRKVDEYGAGKRLAASGRPWNEPVVAPLETVRLATLADLSEGVYTANNVDPSAVYWVELWANGGRLTAASERSRVQRELTALGANNGTDASHIHRFRATERDIYLMRLPGSALLDIAQTAPDVYAVAPARTALRDVDVLGHGRALISTATVDAPSARASTVVLLDTGVAAQHPLLESALVDPGVSVVVGNPSPSDDHGHGTKMAGLAAYADLGLSLAGDGHVTPRNWLQSIRLIERSTANDDDRPFWAERTEEAVLAAEAARSQRRVFNLSIGAPNPLAQIYTSWSVGMDLLGYNEGNGRLMVVAAGTIEPSAVRGDYPDLNLSSPLHDPAQAVNAVTVGALTDREVLPDEAVYGTLEAVAREGELSPYSACDSGGPRPIKPDIVLEGGNCAPDGSLAGIGVESLSILTTSHRHATRDPLVVTWGTSAAAATASGILGEVWSANPTRRPETIRALLIHSARWTTAMHRQMPNRANRLRSFGYGQPRVSRASWSTRTCPTLIVEDVLRPAVAVESDRVRRDVLYYRLPFPSGELLALGETEVSLVVTLSYFIEPNEANRRKYAGAGLRWDMQGRVESDDQFRRRVNRLDRPAAYKPETQSYPWDIGSDTRSRGSVQSDRCKTTAASLAGDRLIAVFPTLGWWDKREDRLAAEIPFALVVTVDAGEADIDLYALIETAVSVPIDV
jgi:hypothetical protein